MSCFGRRAGAQGSPPVGQVVRSVRWRELMFLIGAPGLGVIARSGASDLYGSPAAGLRMTALGLGALLLVALPAGAHVYLVNDICDRQRDRINPERRHSPLARGALSTRTAWVWALVLVLAALGAAGTLLGWVGLAVVAAIVVNWDTYAWYGRRGHSPYGEPAGESGGARRRASGWGKCHPVLAAGHNLVGGGLHFLLGMSAADALAGRFACGEWDGGAALWTGYFGLLFLAGHFHHVARQAEADRGAGVTTVATLWGVRAALLAGAVVLVGSTAWLTVGLVVRGEAGGLTVPLGWLWVSVPLYLLALRKLLAQGPAWIEQRRFQRFYRGLYVVFGFLLAPFFWGSLA